MTTTNIKADGVIEVRIVNQDKVWRGAVEPGDYTRAAELGVTDLSAWTPEILAAWEAQKPPQPTLTELKDRKIKTINSEAQTRILAKYPLWVQANCANGIYSAAVSDQMRADIAAVITAANTATDAVIAAIDETGITAIMVAWPVI